MMAFAAPIALAALALLPVLWWLLKVTPPAPRLVRFPAIRLLFGLEARSHEAARTPPWLLMLRLVLAALVVLAAAQPLLNPVKPSGADAGPLVVAIDDGWASARDWPERRAWLDEVLARAGRAGRPVMVLPTAPPGDGGPVAASRMVAAAEARALVAGLEPKPWPTDRKAAAEAARSLPHDRVTSAVWLADGLDGPGAAEFGQVLQTLGGGLEVVTGRTARLLLPPAEDSPAGQLDAVVRRADAGGLDKLAVRALDGAGRVLGRGEVTLSPGEVAATASIRLPTDLRNQLVRLDIEGENGAASTVLLDERWRRRPIGLAGGAGEQAGSPLLDRLYYVERALAPYAELHKGQLFDLVTRDLSVLVLADVPAVLGTTAERLAAWVERGGVLVRFAGPLLAQAAAGGDDPFLPVRLRGGGRSLGGAMSWTTPMALAAFPETGPFTGLAVPAEVKVTAQVLAEPELDLASRSWASLADGTPLVTARRQGKGWTVLVHTTANAEWGNLALSGLFVDMLRRLTALAEGVPGKAMGPLPPVELLDGFGRLHPPAPAATAITEGLAAAHPGPRHPPGFYGDTGRRTAFNLAPHLEPAAPLRAPNGAAMSSLVGRAQEIDLRPPLLTLALVLAMVDLLASLMLRGLLSRRAAGVAVALLLAAAPARAADSFAPDPFAMEAGLKTRLAYVRTGDAGLDRKSAAGLKGLSAVLAVRSTAALAEPMGVDPERDPVLFFPVLYWPLTPAQRPLSATAAEKLNAYMRQGGLIVFDTGDGDAVRSGGADRFQAAVQGLALPALTPVTPEHVLTRSFYLLKEMPGRFDGGTVWVEDGHAAANDGVSPLVLGGNDWAGAWAVDERGRPLYAAVPGGERQREMALRFGVNLVMYALTGNYKADQVHLPAIMERLGR
jgi:hypothetical protein